MQYLIQQSDLHRILQITLIAFLNALHTQRFQTKTLFCKVSELVGNTGEEFSVQSGAAATITSTETLPFSMELQNL